MQHLEVSGAVRPILVSLGVKRLKYAYCLWNLQLTLAVFYGGENGLSLACAENLAPPPGFDPRTVQPIANRCTD